MLKKEKKLEVHETKKDTPERIRAREEKNKRRQENAVKTVWDEQQVNYGEGRVKWREDRKKSVKALKRGSTLDVHKTKKSKLTEQTIKKQIMIICPVCERVYTISGHDRSNYLRSLKRKEMRYGRPCSIECRDSMMLAETRRNLINVSSIYKEI